MIKLNFSISAYVILGILGIYVFFLSLFGLMFFAYGVFH